MTTPTSPADATGSAPVGVQRMVRPFVVIDPYQYEGDVAFGVWVDKYEGYLLGDGDCYTAEELERSWKGDYMLLTWSELETRLKRPNRGGQARESDERCPAPTGSQLLP